MSDIQTWTDLLCSSQYWHGEHAPYPLGLGVTRNRQAFLSGTRVQTSGGVEQMTTMLLAEEDQDDFPGSILEMIRMPK
jgi:hypothetical protein